MAKTVTLRVDDDTYRYFSRHASRDQRPLSTFIVINAKRHIEECDWAGDAEMAGLLRDAPLVRSLRKGSAEAARRRGRFVG
jgi:hypothetical protein